MIEEYKIIIVGAGPAGLSAATHAAELGISHLLLEAGEYPAYTIHKFQKGKLVMAEPAVLPLRSPMSFAAGYRENILESWQQDLEKHRVKLRLNAQVDTIRGQRGNFQLALTTGEIFKAEFVVLAIGLQSNIRKLSVAGADLPNVQYQLSDPDEFRDETIVVVGGGDAGVENALALAEHNRVFLINREEEFSRCKERNFNLLQAAIKTGKIEPRVNAVVNSIESEDKNGFSLKFVVQTLEAVETIACHRVIARLGANPPRALVESFGVTFPNSDLGSAPELSEHYETNVAGLYIAGALGGYPLIKQALNHGYEVIEYILGNQIEPADEPLLKQKISNFNASCTVSEALAMLRRNVRILSGLNPLQLRELLLESRVSIYPPGEVIFKRNDYSNSFFSVAEGELAALVINKDNNEIYYPIKAGSFFGEMGLISGRRRTATIKAVTSCALIETPRRSMIKLLHSVETVQRTIDEISLKRVVRSCLTGTVPERDLDYLIKTATIKRFAIGDVLFRQGDKAEGLYLIRRGSVMVSRITDGHEEVLSYVVAGNYVGEMALVSDRLRSATVRATSVTEAIMLEASAVAAMLDRNQDIRDNLAVSYRENIHSGKQNVSHSKGNLFSFLMQQGVGEASDVLLIDYSLCIRCNNCETACADTHHGIPLLNREAGPTHGYLHLPNACRHCEHPHCMKDCPPDAIHRSVMGEVYITDNCIGCGNCKLHCPYEAIQMAAIDPTFKKTTFWQVLFGLKRKPFQDENLPKKALKCDLCMDNEMGPACARACPTGAAMRLSPEMLSLNMRGNSAIFG